MDSDAGGQAGKREDQRMTVDHGVSEPAWWTEETVWEHVTMSKSKFGCRD